MNESFEKVMKRKHLTMEEKSIISRYIDLNRTTGFDFEPRWVVDVYRYGCGHKDIIQHPKIHSKAYIKEKALKSKCPECMDRLTLNRRIG